MARFDRVCIKQKFHQKQILSRKEYTFVEFVAELEKFQNEAAEILCGSEMCNGVKISEVISLLESKAREQEQSFNPVVFKGLQSLKVLDREIRIAKAGIGAENRVFKTFQYVSRPDFKVFKNVYLSDGKEETELDAVILTKNGFLILEIKNATCDITISPEGKLLYDKQSCHKDANLGEKMEKKRRLLRYHLEQIMQQKGLHNEIIIDSKIVFSTPVGVRVYIKDQYKKEDWCFRSNLFTKIDNFRSRIEYQNEEIDVFEKSLCYLESESKRFALPFNPEEIINDFSEMVDLLMNKEQEAIIETSAKYSVCTETKHFCRKKMDRKRLALSFVRYALLGLSAGLQGIAISRMIINASDGSGR